MLSIPSLFASSTASTAAAAELVGGLAVVGDDVGKGPADDVVGFEVVGLAVEGFEVVGLAVEGFEVVGATMPAEDGLVVVGLLDVAIKVGLLVGFRVGDAVGPPTTEDVWQLHVTWSGQLQ